MLWMVYQIRCDLILSDMTSDNTPEDAFKGKKTLYEASTQCKNWRFSPDRLAVVRGSLNSAAVAVIRNAFEADEVSPSQRTNQPNQLNRSARFFSQCIVSRRSGGTPFGQIVHHQDSPAMWTFPVPRGGRGYCDNISQALLSQKHRDGLASQECHVCLSGAMCPVVDEANAYRLTALFLATKTTNNPISLESYTSNIPRTSPSDVLDLEFLVAQSLSFEFAAWHSHRALWGLWLDLQVRSHQSTASSTHFLPVVVRCHEGAATTGRLRGSTQTCPQLAFY